MTMAAIQPIAGSSMALLPRRVARLCTHLEILPRVSTANKRSVAILPSDLAASIYRTAGDAAHNATRQRLSFDELKCELIDCSDRSDFFPKRQSENLLRVFDFVDGPGRKPPTRHR